MILLNSLLEPIFGKLPSEVAWNSFRGTPVEFAALILGRSSWKSYGVSRNGLAGEGPHWDIDARKGTKATYRPLQQVLGVIRKSLEEYFPCAQILQKNLKQLSLQIEIGGVVYSTPLLTKKMDEVATSLIIFRLRV